MAHTVINTYLSIDLSKSLNMQSLAGKVFSIEMPEGYTMVSLAVPLLGVECKEFGIIDPINDIKELISRIYNYAIKSYTEVIWKLLGKIIDFLSAFGASPLDIPIGFFGLRLRDFFTDSIQFWERIKNGVLELYYEQKEKLIEMLHSLGIPYPIFPDFDAPEKDLEYIIKSITYSLWDSLLNKIYKAISMILAAIKTFEWVTEAPHWTFHWTAIWEAVKSAILTKILKFLLAPPSIQDIYDQLKAYARRVYDKFDVTAQEMLDALKNFELKIGGFSFGKPFDWMLPINPKLSMPSIDLAHLLGDLKIWLKNFIFQIIFKFIQLIAKLMSLFGLVAEIVTIKIPLVVCADKNA